MGQIGQNIQFMANALNLGTVVTGEIPAAIEGLGLPENEEGLILMPLGHPKIQYDFIDRPMWLSPLPKIKLSTKSLTYSLKNLNENFSIKGELTKQELSQIIWSSYGFSNYIEPYQVHMAITLLKYLLSLMKEFLDIIIIYLLT